MGRPLQTQVQRTILTGSGLGQAGKAGAPQRRLGKGLRSCAPGAAAVMVQPVACPSPASWGPRASITEGTYLEQRCLGVVGPSWGGGAQLGGTKKRWGVKDHGPESCVCCCLRGWRGTKEGGFPAAPQGCQEARPLLRGPAPWSFRPPSGRIRT